MYKIPFTKQSSSSSLQSWRSPICNEIKMYSDKQVQLHLIRHPSPLHKAQNCSQMWIIYAWFTEQTWGQHTPGQTQQDRPTPTPSTNSLHGGDLCWDPSTGTRSQEHRSDHSPSRKLTPRNSSDSNTWWQHGRRHKDSHVSLLKDHLQDWSNTKAGHTLLLINWRQRQKNVEVEGEIFHYLNRLQPLEDGKILTVSKFTTVLSTSFYLNKRMIIIHIREHCTAMENEGDLQSIKNWSGKNSRVCCQSKKQLE